MRNFLIRGPWTPESKEALKAFSGIPFGTSFKIAEKVTEGFQPPPWKIALGE